MQKQREEINELNEELSKCRTDFEQLAENHET